MLPLALVAALAAAPYHSPAEAAAACLPACRSGFVCLQGQCVSACNPQCENGEECVEGGQCVPRALGPTVSDDGERAPIGTHFEMRRTKGFIVAGAVSLPVAYFISLMYGAIAYDNSSVVGGSAGVRVQEGLYLAYAIPLLGPIIGRVGLTTKYGSQLSGAMDWLYSIAFSAAQIAGLTMIVLGARETPHLISDRTGESAERGSSTAPPVRLSLAPGAPGSPLGLTLTLEN